MTQHVRGFVAILAILGASAGVGAAFAVGQGGPRQRTDAGLIRLTPSAESGAADYAKPTFLQVLTAAINSVQPASGGLNGKFQLMIVKRLVLRLRPEFVESPLWLRPALNEREGIDDERRAEDEAPAVIKTLFVSLGVATGEAFEVIAINQGKERARLQGEGLILEPLNDGSAKTYAKQMQDALGKRAATAPAPAKMRLEGYCTQYAKQPPLAGVIYRIASAQRQVEYGAMRSVLAASWRLEQAGKLLADSDKTEYIRSIRQWALWSLERKFDEKKFAKEFVAHARKNIQAAREPWNKQIEAAIAALVPHRWHDISLILAEAAKPRTAGD